MPIGLQANELDGQDRGRTLSSPRVAYIHVPFCRHRCGYCNFTVVSGRDDLIDAYLEATERELSGLGGPHEVDTLFFGGGTPTHLPPRKLQRLLQIALDCFPPARGYEMTVEANPADLGGDTLGILKTARVNRISLGAQSFDQMKLKFLERDHDAKRVVASVDLARRYLPSSSVSLDLIFGLPGESLAVWQADLKAAMELRPDHVSTYELTYERGTALWSRRQKGHVQPVGEELCRAMYDCAIDELTAAGFEHYEVSNFARPGQRCRHNEAYWAGNEFFSVGPGAARYVAGRRETNHRSTTTYLKRVLGGQSPVAESDELSPEDRAIERFVFGMRRIAGVNRTDFLRQTGFDLEALVGGGLRRFIGLGLIEDTGDGVRLTRDGLPISDSIWPHFLKA